jgi:hypothetical protein
MNTWPTPSSFAGTRRRSQRAILTVPVTVSGDSTKGSFSEDTQTMVVNAHGALVPLAARLTIGQKVQLKNSAHPIQQACRVVYVGPTVDGKTQFGVEFAAAAPDFWHVSFPPEDWTPLEDTPMPDKKSKT